MAGEWETHEIGEIADVIGGGTPSTKEPDSFDGDIPWLTPKDLSTEHERYVGSGARSISQAGLERSSARVLPPGAVLLSTRAPVGYVAIAANPIATNQGFRSLVLKPGYSSEFVYYWLTANTPELERHASGTTFRELSGSALKKIEILVPPLPEQRAIAHILGTLDDKIELNRRMSETLEAMARALFKSWFVDFDPVRAKAEGRQPPGLKPEIAALFPDAFVDSELGEIPEGWRVGTVSDLANMTSGKRPQKRSKEKTGEFSIPLYGGGGVMAYVAMPLITEPFLLTGRVGTLGEVLRITEDCWPSDNTLLMFPTDLRYLEFLFFMLQRVDFDSLNIDSTQPLVTQTDLKNQKIVIPDETFMELFWQNTQSMFLKIDKNNIESTTLAAMRNALLPKLVSGEVRVKDIEELLKEATE